MLSILAAVLLLAPATSHAAVCDGFYSPSFALTEGKINPAMPSLSRPAKGARIAEPNFRTCLFRATDHRTEPSSYYLRNDYSRRQAFNANNTYFLAYSNDGSWRLYDANNLKQLRVLAPAADAEPQWHPTDPNTLYYLPTNGGRKLMKVDVRTNQTSTVVDFAGKLPSWASSATHLWTRSEGAPSADGRYWGFLAYNDAWNLLGYIVWDLQQNRLVGSRQASANADNASISASGRWFVTNDDNGVWAWSADFSKKKKIDAYGGVHSDLAFGPEGHDYFVSVDYESDGGDVYFVDLDACPNVSASTTSAPECPRTVLYSQYATGAWSTVHFSGKAFNKPGWILISSYDTQSNRGTVPWFTDKIFAMELKASPKVYPLAFTRRVAPNDTYGQTGADAYWTEPHATVNRDFTRIAFNTNWGNSAGADVDVYMIELPANALGGGSVPPATGPRTGGNLPPQRKKDPGSAAAPGTAALPAVPAATETMSIGCAMCAYLGQAREAMAGFARSAWRNALPVLRSAANVFDGDARDELPASAQAMTHAAAAAPRIASGRSAAAEAPQPGTAADAKAGKTERTGTASLAAASGTTLRDCAPNSTRRDSTPASGGECSGTHEIQTR